MFETTWSSIKQFGNPEYSGLFLVTTKTTGAVCIRWYNGFKDKWNFGEPLAWAHLPNPYKEDHKDAEN